MPARPWETGDTLVTAIVESANLRDPVERAAGTESVTVEFGVPPSAEWETEVRVIRSSVAADDGGVYEVSLRLAEASPTDNSFRSRQVLERAVGDAVERSRLPPEASTRVRGGGSGWNPHIVWAGRPNTRHYEYVDGEQHRLQPRRTVRLLDTAVKSYRRNVEAER